MRAKLTVVALLAGVAALAGSGATEGQAANNQGNERPAPVGHRQPTAQDVQTLPESTGQPGDAQDRKLEEELDRKLKGICKGC
jgi:hypothetical protein